MKLFWLGDERGALTDWSTQQWVRATGRRIDLAEAPWLDGPVGSPTGIGGEFFDRWAAARGLAVRRDGPPRGLLPSLAALAGPAFDPARADPAVRDFYERTSEYDLDAWAEWSPLFRPFGHLVAATFSRRLEQLNVPLGALDTARGTTSEVLHLVEPGGRVVAAAWVRHLRSTGRVLYAGSYSVCHVPGHPAPCVRVVFPLPNGNGVVLLRPEVEPDGALTVVSGGHAFGDPGFYFTAHRPGGRVWARYVRTMRETIRVFPGEGGEVRADHVMWLFGRVYLRLHYRLRPRAAVLPPAAYPAAAPDGR